MKNEEIIVFTDGSSRGNPGRGGYAAIVAFPDSVIELGGREDTTTNNRMELRGAIEGLGTIFGKENEAKNLNLSISVFSDSRYVIRGITEWVSGWKARNWISSQKEPVLNRDLWEKLSDAVDTLKKSGATISWNYVSGHSGIPANERVDVIATSFADKETIELFNGSRADYGVSLSAEGDPALKEDKQNKSAAKKRSAQKAYSYVSRVDGVVQTHTTWAECEARVKGARGAKFKKVLSPSEEAALIAEWRIS